tara:strand:- start:3420 stop:3680 length:261 start_codon:yes stop_codon:yes gene_type:complete
MRKQKKKDPGYSYSNDEFKAYHWCINNGIYISPFCKENFMSWYIDININGKINRSPKHYDSRELWEVIFNYYKYYYEKYAKKIHTR